MRHNSHISAKTDGSQKFHNREYAIQYKMRMIRDDPRGDLKIWKWLLELVRTLGTDGMSSEDTDHEGGYTVYRVKHLGWRRKMEDYLDLIDAERQVPDGKYSRAGSDSRRRIRDDHNDNSDRKPAKCLPINLYNQDWIADQDEDYLNLELQVAKEMTWMTFSVE